MSDSETSDSEMSDSETSDTEMLLNLKTVEERVAFRRKRNQRFLEGCAKNALAEYNSQNGTNFELDTISYENRCHLVRVIIHINFIAESSNGSNDEKKRMFFAEVVGYDERFVSACCILDLVAGMYSGCRFCDHTVYHPRGLCLDPPDPEKRTKKRKQRYITMHCQYMSKDMSESSTIAFFSKLETKEENEQGKGNMNEEKEITESEINEMLSNLKTMEERAVFRASSIYRGWIRKRDQRFFEDCAKIGLGQYNAQNGTNFQLDRISCEDHCFFPGIVYFHVNFIAESSDGSNDKKKRRMFFAEVVGFRERVVNVCCILDPVAGMKTGCEFCDHTVHHPTGVCLGPPELEKIKKRNRVVWWD